MSCVAVVDGVGVLEKEDVHRPHGHAVREEGARVVFEEERYPGHEVAAVGHSDRYCQDGSVFHGGEY